MMSGGSGMSIIADGGGLLERAGPPRARRAGGDSRGAPASGAVPSRRKASFRLEGISSIRVAEGRGGHRPAGERPTLSLTSPRFFPPGSGMASWGLSPAHGVAFGTGERTPRAASPPRSVYGESLQPPFLREDKSPPCREKNIAIARAYQESSEALAGRALSSPAAPAPDRAQVHLGASVLALRGRCLGARVGKRSRVPPAGRSRSSSSTQSRLFEWFRFRTRRGHEAPTADTHRLYRLRMSSSIAELTVAAYLEAGGPHP